ncbi:MAG: FAD-dependent oxidoreductase [Solirubrobacterales bacterium]
MPPSRPHVVVAGGGVAAVEFVLALHDLAGDRICLTIVAPDPDFELRPLRTAEPFARDHVRRHALKDLATRVGADLVAERLDRVDPEAHRIQAGDRTIAYDSLVVAVGGQHVPAFKKALTFAGDTSTIDYSGLLADIDEGYTHTVSFVVGPGTSWPLPLYELALMTAGEAWGAGIDDLRLQLVSHESAPLAIFGPKASQAIRQLLDRAGISFHGSAYVRETVEHHFELLPSRERLDSQRVVTLPLIVGPAIDGLPRDERGFIPTDDQGHVVGLRDVYAAGDGTTFPVKQGGIACQQADAIAELLAAAAGAPVTPKPFRPVLRGRVLAGRSAAYLEHALHGGAGDGPDAELQLWSAPHKVEGRHLTPWLAELEDPSSAPTPADEPGDIRVEVELPTGQDARAFDLHSPAPAMAHRTSR